MRNPFHLQTLEIWYSVYQYKYSSQTNYITTSKQITKFYFYSLMSG